MKSNLVNGCVPAGETCFAESVCPIKDLMAMGPHNHGCPVANNRTLPNTFSCAIARSFEVTHCEPQKDGKRQ